ncbi:hypothetical protein BJ508DRAFT_308265 [Ascobolus immersus RN42]|uniref:Uncharacterized protein n=1 Tax=Ascobolus immersus RN42 TaxID=1160509 RepID=A0A3N4I275_ASCIM|nr:hypothetical protein BJ508DRAFT_308265 [Ascobolus immersus RN42]
MPKCKGCTCRFFSQEDMDFHYNFPSGLHLTEVHDAYFCEGFRRLDGVPYVTIHRSSDLKFYCAIKDCDFPSNNACVARLHFKNHTFPAALKDEVKFVTRKRMGANKLGDPFTDHKRTYEKIIGRFLHPSFNQHLAFSQYLTKDDSNKSKEPETAQQVTPAINSSATSSVTTPTTPVSDTNSHCSHVPETTAAATEASSDVDTHLTPPDQTPNTSASASTASKTKVIGIDEMKAIITAEYNKAVFEEALKHMRIWREVLLALGWRGLRHILIRRWNCWDRWNQ